MLLVLLLATAIPARALETDQYWGFEEPLRDATAAINAKVNFEIQAALAETNADGRGSRRRCDDVVDSIARRFRFPFFQRIETWSLASRLVDRVPANREDEERYRNSSLYSRTAKWDVVRWMPLSPTIESQGVRFGTDKLSHFFSQGAYYHRHHRRLSRRGVADAEAERRAVLLGTLPERTVLGFSSSGVLSRADLEANYEGMRFYDGLCSETDPGLRRTSSGWTLARPFDLGAHVNPRWDESWYEPIYTKRRWRKVREALRQYCGLLDDPVFLARRAAYASRDRESVAGRVVLDLVGRGKLPEPGRFGLESACEGAGEARGR
jgi:hypothetical protein